MKFQRKGKKMKKIKLIIATLTIIITTGCFKVDTMDDIVIYTSVYPIEYVTSIMYQGHAEINSIYPDGFNTNSYTLTDKLISDYSEGDLLIYNGLSDEKIYAAAMINENKDLKIIDASMGMEYNHDIEELWLDPSNLLMIAQNVKNGLKEYITNSFLEEEIEENYEGLKLNVSEIDASLREVAENADHKNIVVGSDDLLFLSKYGLNVLSLEDNDNLTDKVIADVEKLIDSGEIEYVFIKKFDEETEIIQNIVKDKSISIKIINPVSSITEEERENKEDYVSLMEKNIESLKDELYK